ncbi:MAG: hypothetical protein ABR564_04255 [Candidatus Dormibacteria bacterium]
MVDNRPPGGTSILMRCVVASALALAVACLSAVTPAAQTTVGYDISYPQCGGPFPSGPATVGIVGVNGGRVYSANPCLGTGDGPSELAWAYSVTGGTPAFYANTANPGPRVSTHWPSGQTSPKVCAATFPKNDSTACAYDYGWNAARDSYNDAVTAEQQLYGASAHSPALRQWWLDVENSNSWETLEYGGRASYKANDTATVQGGVAYLRSVGVSGVGIYSTSYQWGQITGGASLDATIPDWVAGAADASQAAAFCSSTYSFSGGSVNLSQYQSGGFDVDRRC